MKDITIRFTEPANWNLKWRKYFVPDLESAYHNQLNTWFTFPVTKMLLTTAILNLKAQVSLMQRESLERNVGLDPLIHYVRTSWGEFSTALPRPLYIYIYTQRKSQPRSGLEKNKNFGPVRKWTTIARSSSP